jgi:hypothetical protein
VAVLSRRPNLSQCGSRLVELSPWLYREVGGKSETKAVACEAWNDVKVHMEDLLAGGLPVGEKEVDAIAIEARAAECRSCALSHAEQFSSIIRAEVREKRGVSSWDNKHVTPNNRLDVHKGHRALVLVDDAYLCLSLGKAAKQAVRLIVQGRGLDSSSSLYHARSRDNHAARRVTLAVVNDP